MAELLDAMLAGTSIGERLNPGDPGYDAARAVWNGRFDSRPDMIVRPRAAEEVAEVLAIAAALRMPITIKGNGHSYAGESAADGGMLIDLGAMADVSVDPDGSRAIVGPGATWGSVDAATQAHGLATPGGTVSTVGVAGLTLGGGEGWLGRLHGLTIDNLVGADVVTAAGNTVRADRQANPDLFWALRGGGGNFGIVTSFEFELHPLGPEVLAGQVIYPMSLAGVALRAFRDTFRSAPDAAMGYVFFFRIPPIDAFPASLHGELVCDVVLGYLGPPGDGAPLFAPLRALGVPVADTVGPTTYVALQQAFDAGVGPGHRWYTRGHYLRDLPDAAIDALVGGLEPFPGEFTMAYLGPGGGAAARVPSDATAYVNRDAAYGLHIWPGWMDAADDEANMAWARGLHARMAPYATGATYVNLLAEDEAARVPAVYGTNYERLVRVKERWDPTNVFRGNHNIAPG